jgi:hypothetical protein
MPPAPVRSHISQPLYVVLQLLLQVLLQRHLRQLPCQAVDLLVGQRADARRVVDVEFRHEFRAGLRSEAVELFEGARDELAFEEVDAEDEHLRVGIWLALNFSMDCQDERTILAVFL